MLERREFLGLTAVAAGIAGSGLGAGPRPAMKRVPVIDITDLYHPPQDVGDNLDLIAAYALPEVDLKAVILDVTAAFASRFPDPATPTRTRPARAIRGSSRSGSSTPSSAGTCPCRGPRHDAFAPGPDGDAPAFQQQGVELMLRVLREAAEPVHIVSFGSARPLAVAWNRQPDLLRRRSPAPLSPPVLAGGVSGVERHALRRGLRPLAPLRSPPGPLPVRHRQGPVRPRAQQHVLEASRPGVPPRPLSRPPDICGSSP